MGIFDMFKATPKPGTGPVAQEVMDEDGNMVLKPVDVVKFNGMEYHPNAEGLKALQTDYLKLVNTPNAMVTVQTLDGGHAQYPIGHDLAKGAYFKATMMAQGISAENADQVLKDLGKKAGTKYLPTPEIQKVFITDKKAPSSEKVKVDKTGKPLQGPKGPVVEKSK